MLSDFTPQISFRNVTGVWLDKKQICEQVDIWEIFESKSKRTASFSLKQQRSTVKAIMLDYQTSSLILFFHNQIIALEVQRQSNSKIARNEHKLFIGLIDFRFFVLFVC